MPVFALFELCLRWFCSTLKLILFYVTFATTLGIWAIMPLRL